MSSAAEQQAANSQVVGAGASVASPENLSVPFAPPFGWSRSSARLAAARVGGGGAAMQKLKPGADSSIPHESCTPAALGGPSSSGR